MLAESVGHTAHPIIKGGLMIQVRVIAALLLFMTWAAAQTAPKKSSGSGAMSLAEYEALFERVNNAGRWGKDDALGTLNHITPEKRVAASREVRSGSTVSLARPVAPGKVPGALEPLQIEPVDLASGDIHWHAERLTFFFHGYAYSHVDALSHAAYRKRVYNGGSDPSRYLAHLSVERMQGGIVSRGVLVDLPRLHGIDFLEPGAAYTKGDMEAWEKKTGIRISTGDVLLVRTGKWKRQQVHGAVDPQQQQAGPHPSMAAWLHQRGVAILGDDGATDLAPTVVPDLSHPFHQLAIVGMGMPLLDNLDLDALAKEAADRSRWTFLFVAAPLPLKNATGSPLNPLAIF